MRVGTVGSGLSVGGGGGLSHWVYHSDSVRTCRGADEALEQTSPEEGVGWGGVSPPPPPSGDAELLSNTVPSTPDEPSETPRAMTTRRTSANIRERDQRLSHVRNPPIVCRRCAHGIDARRRAHAVPSHAHAHAAPPRTHVRVDMPQSQGAPGGGGAEEGRGAGACIRDGGGESCSQGLCRGRAMEIGKGPGDGGLGLGPGGGGSARQWARGGGGWSWHLASRGHASGGNRRNKPRGGCPRGAGAGGGGGGARSRRASAQHLRFLLHFLPLDLSFLPLTFQRLVPALPLALLLLQLLQQRAVRPSVAGGGGGRRRQAHTHGSKAIPAAAPQTSAVWSAPS